MTQPPANLLANAVDLAGLNRPADENPGEFRVAIVGDEHGRPQVMLAFGHLQWIFEPHLAGDLGAVLTDAASKAQQLPAPSPTPESVTTAATPAAGLEVPR